MSGNSGLRRVTHIIVGTSSAVVFSICAATSAWAHGTVKLSGSHAGAPASACSPGSLSAKLDLTAKGGSLDSKAGAIVFTDTGRAACSLTGVPLVSVTSVTTRDALGLHEAKSTPRHATPVVLHPARAQGAAQVAAVSITWSDWTCITGSYSLTVAFHGWSHPLVVPSSSVPSSAACTGNGQTLYVGPVAPTTP